MRRSDAGSGGGMRGHFVEPQLLPRLSFLAAFSAARISQSDDSPTMSNPVGERTLNRAKVDLGGAGLTGRFTDRGFKGGALKGTETTLDRRQGFAGNSPMHTWNCVGRPGHISQLIIRRPVGKRRDGKATFNSTIRIEFLPAVPSLWGAASPNVGTCACQTASASTG